MEVGVDEARHHQLVPAVADLGGVILALDIRALPYRHDV
jgi:hypothetical protein